MAFRSFGRDSCWSRSRSRGHPVPLAGANVSSRPPTVGADAGRPDGIGRLARCARLGTGGGPDRTHHRRGQQEAWRPGSRPHPRLGGLARTRRGRPRHRRPTRRGPDFPLGQPPKLTVQMVARLQGFPDTWQFSGRKTAAYRQVGNAFPPPVARALGRAIAAALAGSPGEQPAPGGRLGPASSWLTTTKPGGSSEAGSPAPRHHSGSSCGWSRRAASVSASQPSIPPGRTASAAAAKTARSQ